MFKIGDFSKLSKVSVKTLRYYADIGLLPPAHTDTFTSYRYYTVEQLPRLNRILTLRDLGFTLDQIRQMLDDHLTAEQLRGMYRLRQAEVEQQIDAEQAKLARIERRLRQIEQEGNMSDFDVVLKNIEATTVASLRDTLPTYSHVSRLFEEMFAGVGQNGPQFAGPPAMIYHDAEHKDADVDVELVVPISGRMIETDRIKQRELPAVETMATHLMQGSYEQFEQTYEGMMHWLDANNYQLAGAPREVYLRGPESTQNPDEYLTEIQMPVCKSTD